MNQAPVEFGLALRQGEFDKHQAAVAQHGHEHRHLTPGRAHRDRAAFAPINLHGLGGLVKHLLIDAATGRTDLAQVAAENGGAAGIALRSPGDLFMDAYRREVGVLGQQGLDLIPIRIQ